MGPLVVCLEPNTEIIMYDGSIKKAKDINEKDILMGDDSEPRHIKGCTTGTGTMYELLLQIILMNT